MTRFRPLREVAIGLGSYAVYLGVREVVLRRGGRSRSLVNARRVVALEERFGIHRERAVQDVLLRHPTLLHALSAGYAVFNVGLTVGLLFRLYRRREADFHPLRRTAVTAYLGAQPIFLLFPTAPPRALEGFVDTLAEISGLDLEHPFVLRFYNPVAAMPSLHAAFAVLTSRALARRARGPARLVVGSYPAVVALVIIGTGNHYILDVAVGHVLGRVAEAAWR